MFHFQGARDAAKTTQYGIAAGERSAAALAFNSAAGFYRAALDTGFMPAFQAPRSRSTAGDGGTLAPANQRLISARYREVMHAACER